MAKDPLVGVISTITNSPGAVLQSGIGNVQKALTTHGGGEVRAALEQFISSNDVQNLGTDDKQSIIDVAEIVRTELDQQTPDAGKVARWGKRLLELAERLGVASAPSNTQPRAAIGAPGLGASGPAIVAAIGRALRTTSNSSADQ